MSFMQNKPNEIAKIQYGEMYENKYIADVWVLLARYEHSICFHLKKDCMTTLKFPLNVMALQCIKLVFL